MLSKGRRKAPGQEKPANKPQTPSLGLAPPSRTLCPCKGFMLSPRLWASLCLLLTGAAMASAIGTTSGDAARSTKCLFSDIDGTLVHYYEGGAEPPGPPEVLPLPASATGRMGHISLETLRLAARVRSSGSRLVLVSGTRYSTFVNRLPFLPRADAYVIENGGRVFYPKEAVSEGGEAKQADGNTGSDSVGSSAVGTPALTGHPAAALTEDLKWREQMESVTGPAAQDVKDPADREGPLWDLYRRAVAEGFEVDTNTYYTMLRIKVKTGNSKKRSRDAAGGSGGREEEQGGEEEEEEKGGEAAMKRLLDSLPPGLLVVTNFGMVDICPERSGKHNAAAYLAKEHFGISLEECASMGDDDNDIALANTMGKGAFITTFSSESVEAAAKANPQRFTVAKEEGVGSSEEMLRLILASCSSS